MQNSLLSAHLKKKKNRAEGLDLSTHHTICKAPPLFKMSPQAFICGLEAQPPNEQFAKLLRLAWNLHNGEGTPTP